MADALDSKSSGRKVVWVQVPPPVLLISKDLRLTPSVFFRLSPELTLTRAVFARVTS